jgi:hypothetical protein
MVEINIQFNDQRKGPGPWKFNNALLRHKTYKNQIKECIKQTID